ncbi:MAG: peptidylprolyl isomerase [Sedimentisphaerales bacterium]|nr:peptidylprolyl isomerase [Sedimentisphaerales bacterium]
MKNNLSTVISFAAVFCVISLSGCGMQQRLPVVLMETEFGDIKAELYTDKAPVTAGNFLRYVKEGRFKDAVFYRVVRMDNQPNDKVRIQVLQGGLYDDNHPAKLPVIRHETTKETGVRHKNGMLSMARWGPGTADSEFSICIGDQPELDFEGKRNPDGQGFAAFGRVIEGMDVVRKIHKCNAEGQALKPFIKIEKMSLLEPQM